MKSDGAVGNGQQLHYRIRVRKADEDIRFFAIYEVVEIEKGLSYR